MMKENLRKRIEVFESDNQIFQTQESLPIDSYKAKRYLDNIIFEVYRKAIHSDLSFYAPDKLNDDFLKFRLDQNGNFYALAFEIVKDRNGVMLYHNFIERTDIPSLQGSLTEILKDNKLMNKYAQEVGVTK